MPWPVYSERLASAANATGWTYAYVPSGKRAVIKKMVVDTGNNSTGFVVVMTGAATVFTHYCLAAKEARVYDVMGVAYGGEAIGIYMSAAGMAVACTGYLFDDSQLAAAPPLVLEADPGGEAPADISRPDA